MKNLIKEIYQSIRSLKNDMINKYYYFRINQVKDPYRVMFRTEPYKFIQSHTVIQTHPESYKAL